ncbi:MAG: outer membrane protein transport protein [Candidatus Omnitrophica bacterium]|nr:outer membrane protein transport protein [Candidatus Omnitrophota bacterium]
MRFCSKLILSLVGVSLISASQVLAAGSGAFRVEATDAATAGKGFAFVGEANTPVAVFFNPAGMNQIKSFEVSAGGVVLAPRSSYKDNLGQTTQMRNNEYIIPHLYAVVPVNPKFAIGVGSSSYWGLGTEWAQDSFSKYAATKNEISSMDTMLTASYQVTDQWSIAAGADNDQAKVNENKKFQNLAGGEPNGNFQLKAKDNAWGFRLATMFKINDKNQVGLMYRSPIHHKYIGKVYLDGIGPTYQAASNFSSSAYETRVTEKVVLPQSIVMGYSFKPTNKWTFNIDVEWMNWSRFKQELLGYPDETDTSGPYGGRLGFLNNGNPIDHHWHSTFAESIGGEYAYSDTLRFRGGYFHHAHVIPQGTFSSNLPDSESHGITGGFGYDLTPHLTFDLAYSGLMYLTRKVNNDVASSTINGKYKEYVNMGFATFTYRY